MIQKYYIKTALYLLLDGLLIGLAGILAYILLIPYIDLPMYSYLNMLIFAYAVYGFTAVQLGVVTILYQYTGLQDIIRVLLAVTAGFLVSATIGSIQIGFISLRFVLLTYLLSLLGLCGEYVLVRFLHEIKQKPLEPISVKRKINTLVIGAGEAGRLFLQQMKKNSDELHIVGVVDDDRRKHGMKLCGVPILGGMQMIPTLTKTKNIQQITIAIPSLKSEELERIVSICKETKIPVNLIPSIEDVMAGRLRVQQFREVDVVDLLGRDEIKLNTHQIFENIQGKTLLISGAGGSIGSEIARIVYSFSPKKLLLLGHGENSIYHIQKDLQKKLRPQVTIIPIIADIQDRERIFEVMEEHRPDTIYHAAAHKHVPMMEYNPFEAVKNNVYGTKNMAEAAKNAGVKTFIMISTDKAVNPPNVMGSTKRIAEMLITSLNEPGKTKFAAVRFGNVLGSRGSVVPLFREQIQNGGPVTVTDFRMTRYFMTIPEASRLVIQAGALANGGEIFILDMGQPVKILDLAKKMIELSGYTEEEIPIIETGIRPGEKLYEELLVSSEATGQKVHDKIFVGRVVKGSLTETMNFLAALEEKEEQEMKKALVAYANEQLIDRPVVQEERPAVKAIPQKAMERVPAVSGR